MDIKKLFGQFVRFGLVGVINTLLDTGIFTGLTALAFFYQNPVFANVISYSCGIGCSLLLNKFWTFKQRGRLSGRQLVLFLVINLCALAVSSGMIYLYEGWGLTPLPAKILSIPFSMGVNFIGNKLFVFKD